MRVEISSGKPHPAIVAEAAAWFIEFRAGDVIGEARQQFVDWLRRSPEHIQAYLEVSGVWAELPTTDPEGRIDIASLVARARSDAHVIALPTNAPSSLEGPADLEPALQRPRRRRAILAAAAVVLLATATVFLLGRGKTGESYSTGIGEQRTVQLQDGSTVELNVRSAIQVHFGEQQRDVTLLDGQALFRVAKDKQRPFVVRAGDAQVRAVGTEFDVYKKQSATVVTVVEGRVETFGEPDAAGTDAIMLSAGEQLTVLPHTVTKPTRTDPAVATAWVQKRLVFEETPLRDVAEEFNRYNRRPLSIDDQELEKLRISGVYSSTDPASLINFLRSQNSMRVIETEKQVRVVRRETH